MTFLTSQVRAAGFSPEIRLRITVSENEPSPFIGLATSLEVLREAWLSGDKTESASQQFKAQLESCRHYAATVYTHLDTYGISVDLVFRLRQLRERLLRIRTLLDCLLSDPDCRYSARLVAQLVAVGAGSVPAFGRCFEPVPPCWRRKSPNAARSPVNITLPATVPSTTPCCARRLVGAP
ncbi:MAG: hypothetical protein IPG23_24975 [Burkholderiales bacterium]|nr:hypothetical protein [Burkholderiales bacterium]